MFLFGREKCELSTSGIDVVRFLFCCHQGLLLNLNPRPVSYKLHFLNKGFLGLPLLLNTYILLVRLFICAVVLLLDVLFTYFTFKPLTNIHRFQINQAKHILLHQMYCSGFLLPLE